jgi:hypothetical protein
MRPRTILLLVVTAFALVAEVVLLFVAMERVGGRGFFSPDTLQMRTQAETRSCWSEFAYHRPKLVEFLIAEGYWSPVEAAEPRWIETFHWNRQWRGGTGQLQKELSWRGENWIQWTNNNRQLAAMLWPRVLRGLRSTNAEDQEDATLMMLVARVSSNIADFEQRMAAEKN